MLKPIQFGSATNGNPFFNLSIPPRTTNFSGADFAGYENLKKALTAHDYRRDKNIIRFLRVGALQKLILGKRFFYTGFQLDHLKFSNDHLDGLSFEGASFTLSEMLKGQWSLFQVELNCEILMRGLKWAEEKVNSMVDEGIEDGSSLV